MKSRIQRSMVLVISVTLVIFYAILAVILYNRNLNILESEIRQEARYIQRAIDIAGTQYLEEMDSVDWSARVTCITPDGEVLYDSGRNGEDLENHSQREEVREALATGSGEDVRMSDTVGHEMYYYALLLDDGSVLRVAREMDGLVRTALNVLPVMGALAVLMIVFALFLARWQTKRLIKPINELNLEHPLDNSVYPELTPLLEAMDYAQATPSLSQAQRLKKYSQEGKCTLEVMCTVMDEEKKTDLDRVIIKQDVLRKYFPKSYTPKQMEDTIIRLLEQWQRKKQREQER